MSLDELQTAPIDSFFPVADVISLVVVVVVEVPIVNYLSLFLCFIFPISFPCRISRLLSAEFQNLVKCIDKEECELDVC